MAIEEKEMTPIEVLKLLLDKAEEELQEGMQLLTINIPVDIIREIISKEPEKNDDVEFWRKRADYYGNMCGSLIADMVDGVKFDHITIDGSGMITFTKEQPERKKGKWITCDILQEVKCSECRMCFRHKAKFCPNCGADMRGEQDE